VKPYRAAFTVIALLAATALLLLNLPAVRLDAGVPVRLQLPERLGGWSGVDLVFCQNEKCLRSFRADRLPSRKLCPLCGGALDALALAEHRNLPRDILLSRKQYVRPNTAPALVTVLVSGLERGGIHRPEMCLEGQGWHITGGRVTRIPVEGRGPLPVMTLNVTRQVRLSPEAPPLTQAATFAYWFTDSRRETPYHVERMMWMAADSVFHGRQSRWAYVAILMPALTGPVEGVDSFIAGLYPFVARK
jgi:hypothetical protein